MSPPPPSHPLPVPGMVLNLLDAVHKFGFVPNGARVYYLNRSQPPLLSEMVLALLEDDKGLRNSECSQRAGDDSFVSYAIKALEKEYTYWMRDGEHALGVGQNQSYILNRYYSRAAYPRPEAYREDVAAHESGAEYANTYGSVYANLAAGAESGWDFSSRWIQTDQAGVYNLAHIQTNRVFPVELNAILYRSERNLVRLYEIQRTGILLATNYSSGSRPTDHPKRFRAASSHKRSPLLVSVEARAYDERAELRAVAMEELMWDEQAAVWRDFVLPRKDASGETMRRPGEGVLSASSFVPLWAGLPVLSRNVTRACRVLGALKDSGLIQEGGIRSTQIETGEQWDSPNAWPPLQQMIIEGLERLDLPEATALATSLAHRWLASNHKGWVATGYMMEKYNALEPGVRGQGGEYCPQTGFGWTNGVALYLLSRYGSPSVDDGRPPIISVGAKGFVRRRMCSEIR